VSVTTAGVLLVNLGTPTAATPQAIRTFLGSFLSDRRVVDLPRCLWYPLLYGVVLPRRCAKLAQRYQAIWLPEGSPLLVYSRRQQQGLAACLGSEIPVELAMTYGEPSLATALERLFAQGVSELVVLPLFPQYSNTTTAAVWDRLTQDLQRCRRLPTLHFIRDYATHPLFIQALQHSIQQAFAVHGPPDRLLFSYHGIPQRIVTQGDDYPQRCQATTEAVVAKLSLTPEQWSMSYQSRFGYAAWLQPYTVQQLQRLAQQGVRRLQVICPAFSSDCLETLEEIDQEARAIFLKAGGADFHYIPALNDTSAHIQLLRALITETLAS
jgi:protoporphyrin/coproporphyrin ferrochelatase